MLTIPLQVLPSQIVKVVLGGQNCQLNLYQKEQGLFVDVNANGVDIVTCVIARNIDPIVCIGYKGFVGNLIFVDNQLAEDPNYLEFGNRFNLVYLTDAEYVNLFPK